MVQQNHVIEYSSGEEPRLFYFGSLGGSLIIVAVGFFLTTLIYAVPVVIAFAFAENRGTVYNKFARIFQTRYTVFENYSKQVLFYYIVSLFSVTSL